MAHLEKFEVFYDVACILCKKEMHMLMAWDKHKKIIFTDIASESFVQNNDSGKSYDDLMAEIHGRIVGRETITGVEVFRELYGRLGFRWIIPATRVWGIRQLLDFFYSIFAKHRLKLTGRCKNGQCQI